MTAMTARELRISSDLALPVDAVTSTFVVFGKRGSGKSNAGVVLAEEILKAGSRFSALDPVGHWWGLKARPDGSPGFPVYVFGGPHADLPLEPTAGALMAQVVAESAASIILCTAEFSGHQRARFVTDYTSTLLRLVLPRRYPPLLQVFEEADAFAPQRPMEGEKQMLGAVDAFVRRGRQGGAGCVLITQRSAALSKNVTTQADTLVAFRTIGPQDRNAIDEWIRYHDAGTRRQEVLETLATLRDGESWLWSPEKFDTFGRVQWRRRETFDAASTPRVGETLVQPVLADVDLEQLRTRMAATIERAKADDPKELRRQIADLQRQLAAKPARETQVVVERVEVPVEISVLTDEDRQLVRGLIADLDAARGLLSERLVATTPGTVLTAARARSHGQHRPVRNTNSAAAAAASPATGSVSGPQQRIIDSLAWLEAIGITTVPWSMAAMLAEQSPKSSGFEKNVSVLRSGGYIDGNRNRGLSLLANGRNIAAPQVAPPTNEALWDAVCQRISLPQSRILRALIGAYPDPFRWDDLAARAEQSPASSGFEKNVSVLRSLGFIAGNRSTGLTALPVLFLEETAAA